MFEIKKRFWHVTTKDKLETIRLQGILASDGNEGEGVYAIRENDMTSLESAVYCVREIHGDEQEIYVVTFEYPRTVFEYEPISNVYIHHTWVYIPNSIPCDSILDFILYSDVE